MITTTRFDAAEYLNSVERQAAYITAALETGDPEFVRDAIGIVARAHGMAAIAKEADLNRESLYKALGASGNPEFGTMLRVLKALGLTLSVHPVRRRNARRDPRGVAPHSLGTRSVIRICRSFAPDLQGKQKSARIT